MGRRRGGGKQLFTSFLSVDNIVHFVHTLINNTFIKNGGIIRKQDVGMPMGTNPAPALADLTCYPKESKFMDYLARVNLQLARRFLGTFRFIDDLFSSDNPYFKKHVLLEGSASNSQVSA